MKEFAGHLLIKKNSAAVHKASAKKDTTFNES